MEKRTDEELASMRNILKYYSEDLRYKVIRERLSTFPTDRLIYILDKLLDNTVCLDTLNYNEVENTYCPLALGLGLDTTIQEPTNDKVFAEISKFFQPVNVLKNTPGTFYAEGLLKRYNHLEALLTILITERNGTS